MSSPRPRQRRTPVEAPSRLRARRSDARRNDEQIVATARQVFSELGPEAPLDLIARQAGFGSATLYRHFPTREHLLEAVYRTDVAELARRAVELAEYVPPLEAFERWVRDYFVPAQEERGVASMLKEALLAAPEVFSQGKQQFSDAVDSLVRAAQDSGDVRPDVTGRDIARMAHGIAVSSRGAPDARERMLTVMFDGLRQVERGGP